MKGIALDNCEVGTVSSRTDGSVKFSVITAELRPSERGIVMDYHGKADAEAVLDDWLADDAPQEPCGEIPSLFET